MLSRRHLDALKRQAKRRQTRPHVEPVKLKASASVENRMMQYHADVLNAVESALVQAGRLSEQVDDRTCSIALRASIAGTESNHPQAHQLVEELAFRRSGRPDVSDELWLDALRVVLNSVRRHNQCREGDIDYLSFATAFIP